MLLCLPFVNLVNSNGCSRTNSNNITNCKCEKCLMFHESRSYEETWSASGPFIHIVYNRQG